LRRREIAKHTEMTAERTEDVTAKRTDTLRKSPLPPPARRTLALTPGDTRFAAPPTARFVPAKAVGSFVPGLTQKAFEKFGFATATLLTDWTQIVGAEIAGFTVPERLKWPRGPAGDFGDEEGGERKGATLMLRVDPARALDVEYRARQIIDRINAYFGYRAVEAMRIVQAPLPLPPCGGGREGGTPAARRSGTLPKRGEGSSDEEQLRAALARLENGIRREKAAARTP
jgi:hypothetical protein